MINNHGFQPSIIKEDEHYILGDGLLGAAVEMNDGHGWGLYLPKAELQRKNGLETMNCTAYGTLNAIEILGRKKYGARFQNNLSERFLGRVSGTTRQGNDPHKVCEAMRHLGAVPEAFLPFSDEIKRWEDYYIKIIPFWIWRTGQQWRTTYSFGHDWVFLPTDSIKQKQVRMKEALKYSPLGVSGYAWAVRSDGLYEKRGTDNHWFIVYDYVDGVKWLAYDSYDNTKKELVWDYDFGQAKRFTLTKNTTKAEVSSLGYVPFYLKSVFS